MDQTTPLFFRPMRVRRFRLPSTSIMKAGDYVRVPLIGIWNEMAGTAGSFYSRLLQEAIPSGGG